MSGLRRVFAPLAVVLLAAVIVWPMRGAFDAFVESRSSASPITWALGMTWGFDFAWSVVLGALLGAVTRSRSAMIWAAAAGAAYGGINFAMTGHHFSPSLPWSISAGIYGQYAVSCIGALIGAWLALGALVPQRRPAA